MMPPLLSRRAWLALLGASGLFGLVACTPPSQQDIKTAQALAELGESFSDIRLAQQDMQDQVDSLKFVVARQDSVIRTLANLAGVQVPP
jgi:hypothetical protein